MSQHPLISICGAGTMGSGIAQVFTQHHYGVTLYDVNTEILHKAKSNISTNLQVLVQKNKISPEEKAAMLSSIRFTSSIEECKAPFIIEAVIEDKAVKSSLINTLFSINSPATVIVTNTSSISVSSIANNISAPERFAGMHFFNPAPVMKLVEVVKTDVCSNSTINTISRIAETIGKIHVICKDSPGFIVNRVARPYYLESLYLIEKGIAGIEEIDMLMESTNFKMGPFRLMDLIGNDVNFSVSNIVYNALGKPERLKPSSIQEKYVAEGSLGRKTGKGFYDYRS